MKQYVLIFAIIGIIISCEKQDSKLEPDDILYFNFIPDTSIWTVKYLTPSGVPPSIQDCEDIPTPLDSSATFYLDINNDLINDFYIEARHEQVYGWCGSHCMCFYYGISLNGLNDISFISTSTINSWEPICYDSLISINIDSNWTNSAYLHSEGGGPGTPFSISDCYIGIKINNNYGWINISPRVSNGIIVKEYAINLTENKNIKCGQKE